MATEVVNLNNLISYDFKINFDPLLVALAQKADTSSVTALSNQIEILKQLMGSGGGGGGGGEGGNGNNVVLELMNQITALSTEVNTLRKERQQDTARIEALEKIMQGGGSSSFQNNNHTGINDNTGSHTLSNADSTDITNLADRVTALEDEISHVLAQVSSELAKASPQVVMERLEQQEKQNSNNTGSSSSNNAGNSTNANTTASSFSSSNTPSTVASTTENNNGATVSSTTASVNHTVNNNNSTVSTVNSTVSAASASNELHVQVSSPTPEERILSRPRTPIGGSRTHSASNGGNGTPSANSTGIYGSESYAIEIRQIGERLQALVAQVVPTAEIAAEAKILAENANKRSAAIEGVMQHHEARLQALEKSTGVSPPSGASVPMTLSSSSGSEDLSAVIAALRNDMNKLRNQVDSYGGSGSGHHGSTKGGENSTIEHLQNQINAINDSLRKLGHQPESGGKSSGSSSSSSVTVDSNLHKLEKVFEQLTERVNGIDGSIGNVKADVSKLDTDLTALRGVVDTLLTDQQTMKNKLDATADTNVLTSWAEATTIALTILSGNAEDVTGAKASLGSDLNLLTLANRSNILSNTARPSGSRQDLRFVSNTVSDLEIRLKTLEDKPEIILPVIPPPVDLTPVSSAITSLQDNKVEKGDLDSRLLELNDALAGITKRINDYAKQLKSLNRPSTSEGKSMNDHAALSGKPLLRDLKCLSCDQPLQGLATDRGDYNPHNMLQSHVLPSKAYMFNMTMTQQQNTNGNGGQLRTASPSRPQSQANIMGTLNGTSPSGPFNALPNGVVLNRAINTGFHTLVTNSIRPGSSMGGNRSSPSPHGSPDGNTELADGTIRNGNSVRLPPLQDGLTNGVRTMEGGAPVTVVHRRGSGVAIIGSGGAAIAVASPLVDPRSGGPVVHYFADPNVSSSSPTAASSAPSS